MPINKKLYSNLKKLHELQILAKKYKVKVTKKTDNKLKYKTIIELSNEIKKVKSKSPNQKQKNFQKINKKNKQ